MAKLEVNRAFWKHRPTLVTGASGLVGGWLVRRLLEADADVVCLMRDWVPQSEFVRSGLMSKVRVVRGDICDQPLLERTLAEYEIDSVIHLAAQTIVGVAQSNPTATFETNIQGTWALLDACRKVAKVRQIVLASSDKAYGEHDHLPYREDAPLQGRHPYDVSKSCADLIAQTYAQSYGLPLAITRCGNFYGGGDLNWNRIVPGTIRSILHGVRPLIRSDGLFVRDYFYVEDGAQAYMHLTEQLSERRDLIGQAFNFSNEIQMTVLDVVHQILKAMNSSLVPDVRNEVAHEIRHQYLAADKARSVLAWKPSFNFEQGIHSTIEWYRKFFEADCVD